MENHILVCSPPVELDDRQSEDRYPLVDGSTSNVRKGVGSLREDEKQVWGFGLRSKRWLHVFDSPCDRCGLRPADHSGTHWIGTLGSFESLGTWACHICEQKFYDCDSQPKVYPETKRT